MEIWYRPLELKLDEIDLNVINRLAESDREKDKLIVNALSKYVAKEIKISTEEAKSRIERMLNRLVIQGFVPVVDPSKLWNYLYFIFIKADLSPPVVGVPIKYPKGWKDLMQAVMNAIDTEEVLRDSIREAYALQGTEWDIMLSVAVNNREKLKKICELLVGMNFVERIWSFSPVEQAGHVFRPIVIPSIREFSDNFAKPLKRGVELVRTARKK